MSIKYEKVKNKGNIFLRLTGLTGSEFKKVVELVSPEWDKKVVKKKRVSGRPSKLRTLEDKILCLCIYYRTYITQEFLGYLFDVDESNICRLFKVLVPIMAGKITIKKDRTLTKEKILELILDVTEQPIERPKRRKNVGKRTPKNRQKKNYSGKKKRHTVKKEIGITEI